MQKDTSNLSADNISFIKAYKAAFLWAAFILFLCLLPGEDLPDIDFWEINIEDKLAHVGVFAVLAILMAWGVWMRRKVSAGYKKVLLQILTIGICFGIFTEVLQGYFTTSRYASLSDLVADALGVFAGAVIALFYLSNKNLREL